MAKEEEHALAYFHGALLDEDADRMLLHEGDYLIQSKPAERGLTRGRLFLAVRKNNQIRRFEVQRHEGGFRFLGKSFPSIRAIVEYYRTRNLETGNGELLQMKRAVAKGKFQLVHRDIRLQKKIGAGSYGTVYKGELLGGVDKNGNACKRVVAVKRIDSDGKTEQGLIDMMKEARVMQLYHHKNIVKFHGFIVDRTPYLLVMEFCTDGAVEDVLRNHERVPVSIARRVDICQQAARGLEYLHSKNCIHRDIATRNCLLDGKTLKLADFGMCRATAIYKIDLSKPQNVRWLAPEVWRTGETKYCTDIYAFAVMLWEIFEIPYQTPYIKWKAKMVKDKVMDGYRLPTPSQMPERMAMLMKKCWDHDATRRPIATDVRKEMESINSDFNEEDTQRTMASSQQQSVQSAANSVMADAPKSSQCRTPPVAARSPAIFSVMRRI